MSNKGRLVLFDFDGTITTRDTLFSFTRFACGNFRFFLGMLYLIFPIALYQLKLIRARRAKEIFFSYFFRNKAQTEFARQCHLFGEQLLPKIIRPGALEAILQHQRLNDRIVVVSASPHDWIYPWASRLKIEVIATRLEVVHEKLTGRISGENCNGLEKVYRIKKVIDLSQYTTIIVYGDSSGDIPMLQLAHQKFYKPFR